jgi:hypothetical protein
MMISAVGNQTCYTQQNPIRQYLLANHTAAMPVLQQRFATQGASDRHKGISVTAKSNFKRFCRSDPASIRPPYDLLLDKPRAIYIIGPIREALAHFIAVIKIRPCCYIGFKIIFLARLEGGGCIAIRRRPITQSKRIILKPIFGPRFSVP